MTISDKLPAAPVTEKPSDPAIVPSGQGPTASSDLTSQDKLEGKTPEEIKAMYIALEKLQGKQAAELGELRKAADKPTEAVTDEDIAKLAKLFAPPITEDTPREEADMASLKQVSIQQSIDLAIIKARTDSSMPKFTKYETEIMGLVNSKPHMLWSNTWTKDAYKMVLADNLAQLESEAEERGKKAVTEKITPKIAASVISGSGNLAPPPPPSLTREEKLDLVRRGKMKMEQVILDSLTDAERGVK